MSALKNKDTHPSTTPQQPTSLMTSTAVPPRPQRPPLPLKPSMTVSKVDKGHSSMACGVSPPTSTSAKVADELRRKRKILLQLSSVGSGSTSGSSSKAAVSASGSPTASQLPQRQASHPAPPPPHQMSSLQPLSLSPGCGMSAVASAAASPHYNYGSGISLCRSAFFPRSSFFLTRSNGRDFPGEFFCFPF